MSDMIVFEGASTDQALPTLAKGAGITTHVGDIWHRTELIAEEIRQREIARLEHLAKDDEDAAIEERRTRAERIAKAYPRIEFEMMELVFTVPETVCTLIARLMRIGHWAWETHCSSQSDAVSDQALFLSGCCSEEAVTLLKPYGCSHCAGDVRIKSVSGGVVTCEVFARPLKRVAA